MPTIAMEVSQPMADEIDVEIVESDGADVFGVEAEIRIRGKTRDLAALIGVLNFGSNAIRQTSHPASDGQTEKVMGLLARATARGLIEEFDAADLALSDARRESVPYDDIEIPDLLDVDVVNLEGGEGDE